MWTFRFIVQIREWCSGSWNSWFNLCTFVPLIKWCDGDHWRLCWQSSAPPNLVVFAMATVSSIGHVPGTDLRVNISRTNGRYKEERILSCKLTETAPVLPRWPICEAISGKVSVETCNKPVLWHLQMFSHLNSSQNSSVSIVTRLQAGWSQVQFSLAQRDFSLLQNIQTDWDPPSLLFE
jgi:hypothetical protein